MNGPFFPDLRAALNEGTTVSARFWLALAAILTGAGHLTRSPGWWSDSALERLYAVVPQVWWGWGYVLIGALGMWRVADPRPRLLSAFVVNVLVAAAWTAGMFARTATGAGTLLSAYTVMTLMAHWVLVRTAATSRDVRQA